MKSTEELMKTKSYWLVHIQSDLYYKLETYMIDNSLTRKEFSEQSGFSIKFISQVLNGNFNGSLSKLIELCLTIGVAPKIMYPNLEDLIKTKINIT